MDEKIVIKRNSSSTKKKASESMTIRNAWYNIAVGIAVILAAMGIDLGEGWADKFTAASVGVFQVYNGFRVWSGRKRVGDIE